MAFLRLFFRFAMVAALMALMAARPAAAEHGDHLSHAATCHAASGAERSITEMAKSDQWLCRAGNWRADQPSFFDWQLERWQKTLPPQDPARVRLVEPDLAYLKANPGKVSYATPGNGTIGHMWGELFKRSAGVSMVHIPYRGAGPAINDVLAGQVGVYFDQVASSLPHIKAGKLRALAVSWPVRLEVLPDVPTYAAVGYKQANEPSWFGMVAPAGTPAAAIDRIQQAVAQALKEPAVRERLAGQGLYPSGTTSKEFTAQIAREIEKMKGVAAYAKVVLD